MTDLDPAVVRGVLATWSSARRRDLGPLVAVVCELGDAASAIMVAPLDVALERLGELASAYRAEHLLAALSGDPGADAVWLVRITVDTFSTMRFRRVALSAGCDA